MAKTLTAASIWTALACDSGTRVSGAIPLTACRETLRFEGLLAAGTLTLAFPTDWSAAAEVLPGRIVRLEYADADWDEYRIEEIRAHAPLTTVTAKSIIYDLAVAEALAMDANSTGGSYPKSIDYAVSYAGTVTALLTTILSIAPNYFSTGTVTAGTTMLAVSASTATALKLCIALADALKAATGTTYYVSARRNGTTGYYIDLTDLNSTAAAPDIRTGKNLLGMTKTWGREWASRVYPQMADGSTYGAGAAWWVVSAISTNTYIDVIDPALGGVSPLVEDDALNGAYWYDLAGSSITYPFGRLRQITDSVVVGNAARLYMSDTSDITANETRGRIVTSASTTVSAATMLPYVDSPSTAVILGSSRIVTLGVPESYADNLMVNATLANWTSGQIDYCAVSSVGGSSWPTKDTATYETGGASAAIAPNQGFRQYTRIELHPNDRLTARCTYQTSGSGTNIAFWFFYPGGSPTTTLPSSVGAWLTRTHTSAYTPSSSATSDTIGVQFHAYGGSGTLYMDRIELLRYNTETAPVNFVPSAGTSSAWLRGVTYLQNPPITYEATLLDLSRLNDGTWPYDTLVLGGPVNVTDLDLDLTVSARVSSIDRNHLNPLATKVTLSTQRDTLTRLLITGG